MAKKKLPQGGGRAAKMAAKQKPSQPVQRDKFGLFLLLMVFMALVGCIVVWDMNAQGVDAAMIFKPNPEEYRISAQVISYQSQSSIGLDRADGGMGSLTEMAGEVDVVVLNKGSLDGVRVGDIFRPAQINTSSGTPFTSSDQAFVEFAVFDAQPTQCRAWIILGRTREARKEISLDLNSMQTSVPVNSQVTRDRASQTVRNALVRRDQ